VYSINIHTLKIFYTRHDSNYNLNRKYINRMYKKKIEKGEDLPDLAHQPNAIAQCSQIAAQQPPHANPVAGPIPFWPRGMHAREGTVFFLFLRMVDTETT
jgi:hypothetical protein